MGIENISEGKTIKIKGKSYEVVKTLEEFHHSDHLNEWVDIHEFLLHESGDSSPQPTHMLRFYPETKELFFFALKHDKPSEKITHSKHTAHITSFTEKVQLTFEDIQVAS